MNSITRSVLGSVLLTDSELTESERTLLRRLVDGGGGVEEGGGASWRLLSQAEAAKVLAVSRVTVWRMVRQNLLHPVEILPGELRYPSTELELLVSKGWRATIREADG